MQNMSRQDLQGMFDNQRRWLFDRLLRKNDYLTFSGQFRDKIVNQQYLWHQDTQQMVKQVLALETQVAQRLQALESRLSAIEQQSKDLQYSSQRIAEASRKASQIKPKPQKEAVQRGWSALFDNS